MKFPRGSAGLLLGVEDIVQPPWKYGDKLSLSGLKMDVLTVSALDKIHTCVDLLIANGKLKDMGSIKANYFAYLDPQKIDYDTPAMWEMLGNNELIDAFQLTYVELK